MEEALVLLKKLNERAAKCSVTGNIDFNPGWHTALDLKNLLTVSEAITRAAIERKESRGGQYRDDFPQKDPEWGKKNIVVKKQPDGSMSISERPITEMPEELKQIIQEMG